MASRPDKSVSEGGAGSTRTSDIKKPPMLSPGRHFTFQTTFALYEYVTRAGGVVQWYKHDPLTKGSRV